MRGMTRALLVVSALCCLVFLDGCYCARGGRRESRSFAAQRLRHERERESLVDTFFETPEGAEPGSNASWAWPRGFLGPQFSFDELSTERLQGKLREELREYAGRRVRESEKVGGADPEWFGFIPDYVGTLMPESVQGHVVEGHCYKEVGFEMDIREGVGTELRMIFYLAEAKGEWYKPCVESMVVFSGSGFKMLNFGQGGTHKVIWTTKELTEQEMWYLYNRGLHVFLFRKGSWASIIEDVYHTLSLFVPFGTQDVNPYSERDNLEFLRQYQQIKPYMEPRNGGQGTGPISLNSSLIHSGDFMGILRLDGLDPMLAWATGSTTGHTAIALRKPEVEGPGGLHICESTAKDAYWDTNGIQCTPFEEWLQKASKAEHHVVWAPLAPEYRRKFNEVQAWEFFESVEGLDYGYENMLFSWLDTFEANYPCIPPKYDRCFSWILLEVLAIFFDRVSTSVAQKIWLQAFNKRVGTTGLHTLDLFRTYLEKKPEGMDSTQFLSGLPAIPEQDGWEYQMFPNMTQTGPAMVCSVFVCRIWKEAGLFQEIGNKVNCGEFTPYDVHKLGIFDANFDFPEECDSGEGSQHQGGDTKVCQIMGKYTLHLNDHNTVDMSSHMAEACPSFPPKYERSPTC
ncbi:hypothetical protein HOP50_02g12940 [Chloropicon primus]|uniref:Uncharacterized protein n=1 Tax=Chloropicon primus TaxID=1764295 RepID=A0A5B8MHF1_9CHLO|nr:hypothetical protein A3770_02p13080 [Chloropicon primus]UPQ97997.1 hypothetical protein HOP50_02g12940 [Chloropicon primus]|mmetsp:Transcript_13571/g.38161  ORF Transcript_13571/g.38161 Transcript_13571/m.38161 type:complete len:627 (+) Transcript_13571:337-2217(+)|eukprot:QDZ18790.1 hypothetical protein A3770_02p13080 [Chloropicon primus]